MEQKQFEQLLSQVAEWEYPVSMDDAAETYKIRKLAKDMRKKGATDEEIIAALEQYRNDTFPAKLVKIIPQAQACPDCGKNCPTGRVVDYRLYRGKKGQQKWCGKCSVCRKQTNPYDGEYSLTNLTAANVWWEWIRTTGVENPRKPAASKPKLDPEEIKKKYGLTHL